MKIFIHTNYCKKSSIIKNILNKKLNLYGFQRVFKVLEADIIMVIGGDGTMLSAIRKYKFLNIPFVGINSGNLGFLIAYSPNNLDELLNDLKNCNYTKRKYFLLSTNAISNSKRIYSGFALNEVIIKHIEPNLMSSDIFINNEFFNKFTGDGLVISTPIGSTGYAIWLGGAAIESNLNIFQLTPIAPNDNAINRPFNHSIILPNNVFLNINILKAKNKKIIVACDGKNICENEYISSIDIKLSNFFIEIILEKKYNFFNHYKRKIIDKK